MPSDTQPFILVAKELSPSQLAHRNPDHVLGIATLAGSMTSHSAIMARALGVPLVSGLEAKSWYAPTDGRLVDYRWLDMGSVHLRSRSEAMLNGLYPCFSSKQREDSQKASKVIVPALKPVTQDGKELELSANISSLKELDVALYQRGHGVGLFRTEFLYMDRARLPREEEQFEVYRMWQRKLRWPSVVIRTLDIGGDKHWTISSLPEEDNPFPRLPGHSDYAWTKPTCSRLSLRAISAGQRTGQVSK